MYTYDIDAAAMFDDRTHQFEKFGIPLHQIDDVRSAVTERACGLTRRAAGFMSGLGWPSNTPSAASTAWRR